MGSPLYFLRYRCTSRQRRFGEVATVLIQTVSLMRQEHERERETEAPRALRTSAAAVTKRNSQICVGERLRPVEHHNLAVSFSSQQQHNSGDIARVPVRCARLCCAGRPKRAMI